LNPFYQPDQQEQLKTIPITFYVELRLWKELYFKWTEWNSFDKHPDYVPQDEQIDNLMRIEKEKSTYLKMLLQRS